MENIENEVSEVAFTVSALRFDIDYRSYDFELHKPDICQAPDSAPMYLFLKMAKEYDAEVHYRDGAHGGNAQFRVDKTDEEYPLPVWFGITSIDMTTKVLTISWEQPFDQVADGAMEFTPRSCTAIVTHYGSLRRSENGNQTIKWDMHREKFKPVDFFDQTRDDDVKNNKTILYYYNKITKEMNLLKP